MARRSPAPLPSSRPRREILRAPGLTLPPQLRFPFRQEVRVPIGTWATATPVIEATFRDLGYRLTAPKGGRTHDQRTTLVAETGRHRIRMNRGMKISVYTLFGAGMALGVFDGVVVGAYWFILPWGLGAAGMAALFWYRFARRYESDVVVVSWAEGQPLDATDPGPPSTVPKLVWWGGRVRSTVRGSTRTGARVEAVPQLAGELAAVVRAFNARWETGIAG
jgi:hypothetical protein